MDLALDNLQKLICHKIQTIKPNKTQCKQITYALHLPQNISGKKMLISKIKELFDFNKTINNL